MLSIRLSNKLFFWWTSIALSMGLLWFETAQAATVIQVTSISGYSNATKVNSTTEEPFVYGGIMGPPCTGGTTTSTCNNCDTGGACNTKRIHSGLQLSITVKVIGELKGTVYVGYTSDSATKQSFARDTEFTAPLTLEKNGVGTIVVNWSAICEKADGTIIRSTCETSSEVETPLTIHISVGDSNFADASTTDVNVVLRGGPTPDFDLVDQATCHSMAYNALCGFKAYPGDKKIYASFNASDLAVGTSCTNYIAARVFYSDVDFASAAYGGDFVDLPIDPTNCNPDSDWIVDGLLNDVIHYFRISMVDIAYNNIFLIEDPSVAGEECELDQTPNICRMVAVPGTVNGLLPEDLNCFIATAAYGSSFEPKLKTLREFRNQILKTSHWGRELIRLYYDYGPKAAQQIAQHENIKAAIRIGLWPVYGLAWLSLHYSLWGTLLIVVALVGLIWLVRKDYNRSTR